MMCGLGLFIPYHTDTLPPAHQPKSHVPATSTRRLHSARRQPRTRMSQLSRNFHILLFHDPIIRHPARPRGKTSPRPFSIISKWHARPPDSLLTCTYLTQTTNPNKQMNGDIDAHNGRPHMYPTHSKTTSHRKNHWTYSRDCSYSKRTI